MNIQVSTFIFLSILSLLAVLSCIDVFKRIIPNALCVLILMMTLTAAAFADDTIWSEILVRFVVLFIPLIALYIGGTLGAGDVKLIFALLPIIPFNALTDFAVYTVFFGALLAIFVLVYIRSTPAAQHRTVPYGVAISGAIFVLAAQGKLLI